MLFFFSPFMRNFSRILTLLGPPVICEYICVSVSQLIFYMMKVWKPSQKQWKSTELWFLCSESHTHTHHSKPRHTSLTGFTFSIYLCVSLQWNFLKATAAKALAQSLQDNKFIQLLEWVATDLHPWFHFTSVSLTSPFVLSLKLHFKGTPAKIELYFCPSNVPSSTIGAFCSSKKLRVS